MSAHVVMCLLDFLPSNPRITLESVIMEVKSRTDNKVEEKDILKNYQFLVDQVCSLEKPANHSDPVYTWRIVPPLVGVELVRLCKLPLGLLLHLELLADLGQAELAVAVAGVPALQVAQEPAHLLTVPVRTVDVVVRVRVAAGARLGVFEFSPHCCGS